MLSVKEAQYLREQLQISEGKMKVLQQQHTEAKAKKDRAGMLRISKDMKVLEVFIDIDKDNLKDAPAEPWEPEKVWTVIHSAFGYDEEFQENKTKFLKECEQNIAYALEWGMVDIVKLQKKAQMTSWVSNLQKIENLPERIEKFYTYKKDFVGKLTEEIIRGAQKQTSKSTSQSANLVEAAQLEAVAELYRDIVEWGFSIERAKNHFESWKELQKED